MQPALCCSCTPPAGCHVQPFPSVTNRGGGRILCGGCGGCAQHPNPAVGGGRGDSTDREMQRRQRPGPLPRISPAAARVARVHADRRNALCAPDKAFESLKGGLLVRGPEKGVIFGIVGLKKITKGKGISELNCMVLVGPGPKGISILNFIGPLACCLDWIMWICHMS